MTVAHPPLASTRAITAIAALLERRTGQQIAESRLWRIDTVLKPVMRNHGIATLDHLAAAIAGARSSLADDVVEALLNHETSFFRDGPLFDQLVDAVAQRARETPHRRQRIWSVGCSFGQEPLSLAMLFADHPDLAGAQCPEITATDVSVVAIDRAREGRYSQFEVQRGLPIRRLMQHFDSGSDDQEWHASAELVSRIRYRQHHVAADEPLPGRFDLILCRNVLIYFAPDQRQRVFARLAAALRPDGLLVLGAGETVIGQTDALVPSTRHRGYYELRGG
ncbi:CheR family methyltransferase [Sphingomonas sp. CJ99]